MGIRSFVARAGKLAYAYAPHDARYYRKLARDLDDYHGRQIAEGALFPLKEATLQPPDEAFRKSSFVRSYVDAFAKATDLSAEQAMEETLSRIHANLDALRRDAESFSRHALMEGVNQPDIFIEPDFVFNASAQAFHKKIVIPIGFLVICNPYQIKGLLAHEFGHIINRDPEPRSRAEQPHYYRNETAERAADHVAGELCGDEGACLAEGLNAIKPYMDFTRQLAKGDSWEEQLLYFFEYRVLTRNYPNDNVRMRYLTKSSGADTGMEPSYSRQ